MLVPAYISSDASQTTWDHALPKYAGAYYTYVVSGPNSAPPPDNRLTAHINAIRNTGAVVIGYVNYPGGTPLTSVLADVRTWKTNYPYPTLAGIFFDQTDRSTETDLADFERALIYAQSAYAFMSSGGQVVFNNGSAKAVTEKYMNCIYYNDWNSGPPFKNSSWVTFEGSDADYRNTVANGMWYDTEHAWVHNYHPGRFANLVYTSPVNGSSLNGRGSVFNAQQVANAGRIYATDGPAPPQNTWGVVAADPLWGLEQDLFAGKSQASDGQFITTEVLRYSASQCPQPSPLPPGF
jgi:hypothetical protein